MSHRGYPPHARRVHRPAEVAKIERLGSAQEGVVATSRASCARSFLPSGHVGHHALDPAPLLFAAQPGRDEDHNPVTVTVSRHRPAPTAAPADLHWRCLGAASAPVGRPAAGARRVHGPTSARNPAGRSVAAGWVATRLSCTSTSGRGVVHRLRCASTAICLRSTGLSTAVESALDWKAGPPAWLGGRCWTDTR